MSMFRRSSQANFALAVLAALGIPAAAASGTPIDVHIRVLKIERVQSWETKQPDGSGGINSIRTEGDVTALFPKGLVVLKTELSPAASESAITEAIRDRVSFGNAQATASRVAIEGLKSAAIRLDDSQPAERIRFERKKSPHSSDDYELKVGLKSTAEDEIILDINFLAGWSSRGGRIVAGVIGSVFHENVAVRPNKILLVGFPAPDGGSRGSIYWLAVGAMGSS